MIKRKNITGLIIASALICVSFSSVCANPEDSSEAYDEEITEFVSENTEDISNDITSDYYVNDTAEFYSNNSPAAAIYNSYTFGSSISTDTKIGNIKLYDDGILTPVTPDASTYNLSYAAKDITGDYAFYRTERDGQPCAMTTLYYRPLRKDKPTTPGYISFDAGSDITIHDRNLTFEIEYFDEGTKAFGLNYVNGPNSGNFNTIKVVRTNSLTWKTATINVTDAYFNRSSSTGLNDGKCDYRIDSMSNDIYIKKVTVSTCSYDEYLSISSDLDAVTLPVSENDLIDKDFSLPVLGDNGCNISWSSNSPAITINDSTAEIHQSNTVTEATLTATVSIGNCYLTKSFQLNIAAGIYKIHALTIGKETMSVVDNKQKISVPISYADTASGTCNLVFIASDNTTGKILDAVMTSHNLGEEKTFNLNAELDYSANIKYTYYILNSSNSSLRNCAPAKVNPTVYTKNRQIHIDWKSSPDDFKAVSYYVIYIDGEEKAKIQDVGSELEAVNSYLISNAVEGQQYNISVVAYDHEELASEPTTITASLTPMLSIDLADCENSDGGISFVLNDDINSGDSYSEQTERGGVICRKNVYRTPINNKSLSFLYFSVDKSVISSDEPNVTLEITYFDEGTGSVLLQYNASDGSVAKELNAISLSNSQTWKTAVINLTNAGFCSPIALTYSDFRITGKNSNNGEVYISTVKALPTDQY